MILGVYIATGNHINIYDKKEENRSVVGGGRQEGRIYERDMINVQHMCIHMMMSCVTQCHEQ